MKLNRDVLMKVGIVAAVAIIIYLLFKSRASCGKSGYAQYAPDDTMTYDDGGDDDGGDDGSGQENYTLMESTLDDEDANGMFEPGA